MDKILEKFGLTATTFVMLVLLLVLLAMVIFLSAKVFSLSRKYDKLEIILKLPLPPTIIVKIILKIY